MREMLRFLAFVGSPAAVAGSAVAGTTDWVEFVDQTDTRLIAHPSLGTADPDEKDYAWGDVDNDGDIDLVVVRKQSGSNSIGRRNVFFRNESGVLVDRTVEFTTDADDGGQGFLDLTPDRDVALVDVDQDGWLDIVTAPTGDATPPLPKTISHPRVYINMGDDPSGNWLGFRYEEARTPEFPEAPHFTGVGFGDVDGLVGANSVPDLYFTDGGALEDRLLLNDGTGHFHDGTQRRVPLSFVTGLFGAHAVVADLNHDGYNDILKSDAAVPHNLRIAYNDPANPGFFPVETVEAIARGAAHFVTTGDLNNDGLLDVAGVDDGSDRYFLNVGNGPDGLADFHNDGNGSIFSNTVGFGGNVVIADLDNDGFNDVLIADVDVGSPVCTNNRLKILHNLGGPPVVTFEEDPANLPTTVPGGPLAGTHDIAVFDIDGDGWNDLVIGTCHGTTVWINQRPCPADIDRDGAINVLDLIELLLCFGQPAGVPCGIADVNQDGAVNVLDLIELLLVFGTTCP